MVKSVKDSYSLCLRIHEMVLHIFELIQNPIQFKDKTELRTNFHNPKVFKIWFCVYLLQIKIKASEKIQANKLVANSFPSYCFFF